MSDYTFPQLLDHCKNRMHEDLGVQFLNLLSKALEINTEELVNADRTEIEFRQGYVQALKHLYEGLTDERRTKRKQRKS